MNDILYHLMGIMFAECALIDDIYAERSGTKNYWRIANPQYMIDSHMTDLKTFVNKWRYDDNDQSWYIESYD